MKTTDSKQKSTNQESYPSTILPETSLKIPMPVQNNTYQAPVGIGGVQGNISIKDNAKVSGIINEYSSHKLNEIAQEITKLLDYFQNNPPIVEAKQQVDTAIKNYPELKQPEIIEATIIENPTLKQRLFSASIATTVEIIKMCLPPFGVAIEALKAYQKP